MPSADHCAVFGCDNERVSNTVEAFIEYNFDLYISGCDGLGHILISIHLGRDALSKRLI